jgi:glucuronoarabinoxylan endo-1,4-beta-xylanase
LWGANASTTTVTGPNTGLVNVNRGTVTTSGRLWAFAGFSRFIRPGAVRIGTTTSAPGLEVSAFRNRDGSLAVVVLKAPTAAGSRPSRCAGSAQRAPRPT